MGGDVRTGNVIIVGVDEIERLLTEAGAGKPFEKKILARFFKEASKPMVSAMKSTAPIRNENYQINVFQRHFTKKKGFYLKEGTIKKGNLKKSIGIVQMKDGSIWVGPRFGKKAPFGADGYYFRWTEFGVAGKKGDKMEQNKGWMRRAIDATSGAVIKYTESKLGQRYMEWFKKGK